MSQSKWMHMMTALFTILALTARVGMAEDEGVERLKRDSVRLALDGNPTVLPPTVLEDAIARAGALVGLAVDSTLPAPVIALEVAGNPQVELVQDNGQIIARLYDTIVIPDPRQVVIDGNNLISGVKVYLSAVEPRFITTLEIAVSGPAAIHVQRRNGEIILTLNTDVLQWKHLAAQVTQGETAADIALGAAKELALRVGHAQQTSKEEFGAALRAAVEALDVAKMAALECQLLDVGIAAAPHPTQDLRAYEELIQQRVSDFRNAVREQDANRAKTQLALHVAAAAIKERAAQARQLLSAGAPSGFAAELEVTQAADATLLAGLLRQIEENESVATQRLADLSAGVDAGGLATLARQLERRSGALHQAMAPPNSIEEGLTQLGSELARLQSTGENIEGRLLALGDALESVKADSPQFNLDSLPAFAALSGTDLDLNITNAPPARRARPSRNSRTALAAPKVTKLRMLRSSDEEFAVAEDAGVIVMAQASEDDVTEASDAGLESSGAKPGRQGAQLSAIRASTPRFNLYNPDLAPEDDPLRESVNIDFREMPLTHVVSLLAKKAQINVIAGTEVSGTVTANLQNIPLGRAIEIVLRMNGLGIIEEDGVYRITTYEEAVASRRDTRMLYLKNATATEVKDTLDSVAGPQYSGLVTVSVNETANVLIISGPSEVVQEFEALVKSLDIAEPSIPTITVPIKLNYSEPSELVPIVQPLLSSSGVVSGDARGRHLIITDIPIKVEAIRALVESIDLPVKQVSIEAMIVDAIMADDAQTGIDWIANAIRSFTRAGNLVGDLSELVVQSDFTTGSITQGVVPGINLGGQIAFGILSGDIDLRAAIAGEVRSENAELLANPIIVTVENKLARISIAEEIPYQELTQTTTGPPIATTEFKEVGTILEVTPRVTHDNHVIIELLAKQSDTKGESVTGVPPEDKREAQTTLRLKSGQTVFIGGLRRFDDEITVRKVPVLGDIPVLGLFFRNHSVVKKRLELLIFLTCHVLPENIPDLVPSHKVRFDALGGKPERVDATRALLRSYVHPEEMRDPFYKWRRKK